jgi:NitT/TauT family transport system substrate-binding protein
MPQGASQASMLPLLLEANGLTESDIEIVNTPNDARVATLLQGDVDAIMGGADSSSVQLEQQGADFKAMLWADYGVSTVAQSIFANESFLNENPDQVKAFVAASVAGWAAADKDPEGAATDLKQVFPEVVETTALAELKGVIPLLCAGGAEVMGRAEPAQWQRTGELLTKAGLLPAGTSVTDYYTYDYLPPKAELPVCG